MAQNFIEIIAHKIYLLKINSIHHGMVCKQILCSKFLLPRNDFLKISAIQYNIIQNTLCVVSKGSPPFINIPLLAPIPVPTITAVGVARPKAQGQAISRTASACVKAWLIS